MNKIQLKKAFQLAIASIASGYPQDFERAFGLEGLEQLVNATEDFQNENVEDVLKSALDSFDTSIGFKVGDQVIVKETREIKQIEVYNERMTPPIILQNDNNLYFPNELTFG